MESRSGDGHSKMRLIAPAAKHGLALARHLLAVLNHDRIVRTVFLILLTTLSAVLILATAHEIWDSHPLLVAFDLTREHTIGEAYGYALSAGTFSFCVIAWRRSRLLLYLAFGLVFLFALLDDALMYHERFAYRVLVPLFDLPALPGARPQDTGELLAWAIAGVALLVPLLLAARQSASDKIPVAIGFVFAMGLLGAFGVGADMVHSLVSGPRLITAVALVEDGGELIALALAFVIALIFAREPLGEPKVTAEPQTGSAVASGLESTRDPLRRPSRLAHLHAEPERQGSAAQGVLR